LWCTICKGVCVSDIISTVISVGAGIKVGISMEEGINAGIGGGAGAGLVMDIVSLAIRHSMVTCCVSFLPFGHVVGTCELVISSGLYPWLEVSNN
jgi:hypothetical protein